MGTRKGDDTILYDEEFFYRNVTGMVRFHDRGKHEHVIPADNTRFVVKSRKLDCGGKNKNKKKKKT
jgi:hypothetical protein